MDGKLDKNLLEISESEQYRTIDELLERSKPNATYYTLLVLSSLIIAVGLLLNSASVVIGGMLVTPVLIPVLAMALGISTGEIDFLRKEILALLGKSFVIILIGSFFIALIFGAPSNIYVFENTVKTAILYFIVALSSGIAATFAWTRKEISEVLPGISIAVSLVPPLSLIGISLSLLDFEIARFYFLVFLFNLLGITMGSLIVFSLLKFHKAGTRLHNH